MSITQDDFKKIWASTSSVPEYTFSDSDYQNGWEFVGNLPPTRAMWDALQRRNDQKMKYLQDNGSMCFDSVSDMVASNLEAGQTALTKGYYSVNDGGSALYTIRAKDVADVEDGGSIIFLDNENVAELIPDGTVNVKQFGAKGDGTTDDSTPMQNMINFAKAKGIDVVDINCDVAFKNVELSASITLDFHNHIAQGIRYHETTERSFNMLYSETSDTDIAIKNAKFKGNKDNTTNSGTKPPCIAIILIKNANDVKFINCSFTYISGYWYATPLVAGFVYRLEDCKNFLLKKCYFDNLQGEEVGWVLPSNLTREEVNAVYEDNVYGSSINTSAMDFIGNKCVMRGNTYKHSYAGSMNNCFGLNVYAEDEIFSGSIHDCYDNNEDTKYQGESFVAKRITVEQRPVNMTFKVSASNILIDGGTYDSPLILGLRMGYNAGNTGAYQETTPLSNVVVTMRDIITTTETGIIGNQQNSNYGSSIVTIENCDIHGCKNGFLPCGGILTVRGCKLRTVIDSSFSGSSPLVCDMGVGSLAYRNPNTLIIDNCTVISSGATAEYIFAGNVDNVICCGNVSDSTNGITGFARYADTTYLRKGFFANNIEINNVGQIPSV